MNKGAFRGRVRRRSFGVACVLMLLAATNARVSADDAGPYSGTPAPIPGHIEAEDFDNGGEGVAYHDTTAGNAGGAYRATDVDIEPSSAGGYDVGWTDAGEWLNYTVVANTPGVYNVQLAVASPSGGVMHVGFNGPSNAWISVSVPATGGWQNWTTVTVPVTINAGTQQMTVLFDSGGVNFDYADIQPGEVSESGGDGGPPATGGGTDPVVLTWNLDVDEPGYGGPDHAAAAMDYIARMNPLPQIVIVQEALRSHYGTYISELQNRTGQSWTGVFATHCAPGAWNGGWCGADQDEGVGVFTTLPLVDSSTSYMPYADDWHSARAIARAAVNVGGRVVQVFAAHMSNTPSARYGMMAALVGYTQNFPSPQIVGGDFNADPDQIDQANAMGSAFLDTWSVVGSGPGYTCTTPYPTMHLDYLFGDYSGLVQPLWSAVITDPGAFSDHYPVMAAYVVR